MTTFERIKKLAQKLDISIKDLSKLLGFGESTIYKWKTQSPKVEHLQKVADYFNVSTDYLLGRTDLPTMEVSDKEIEFADSLVEIMSNPNDDYMEIISKLANLNPKQLHAINQLIDTII